MPEIALGSRSTRPTRLHTWLPIVLALGVAVAAGWSIVGLNAAGLRTAQDARVVPEIVNDMARPETLLLVSAAGRLAARGHGARAATPGAPPHMAVYYVGVFSRLARLRRSSGQHRLVDAVSRTLEAAAETQDSVYAGGAPALVAARRAPAVVAALRAATTALDRRLADQAGRASDVATGGTMLIMLFAAVSLIVLLRRFDRLRRRMTNELQIQATHDPLTGLANRRRLSADLADVVSSATAARPARLVVFDLDGFKAYNDAFGHHGGDLLLARLARALSDAVAPQGHSYRLGGDEFCVLFPEGADAHVIERCVGALSETGEAFSIASSHGSVLLPTETADPDLAMQLADERMYAEKNSNRSSAGQQTRNLALKILGVRAPDVEHHSEHVATLAAGVGRQLGLSDSECAELVRAAELHDIGKIAIPWAILHKPAALDEGEWELMRRHPTIGANILSAAPALDRVAEIVRASHERFDGNGYPLGIAGAEIPLASRIVFVCDAYDAMVSSRAYSAGTSPEGALDELRRGAGTQFDPLVVEAFCEAYRESREAGARPGRVEAAATRS